MSASTRRSQRRTRLAISARERAWVSSTLPGDAGFPLRQLPGQCDNRELAGESELPPPVRVQRVAQAVADEVDAHDGQEDHHAGRNGDDGELLHLRLRVLEQVAPG